MNCMSGERGAQVARSVQGWLAAAWLCLLLVVLMRGGQLCVPLALVPLLHPQKRYDQHSRMDVDGGPACPPNVSDSTGRVNRETGATLSV